MTDARQLPARDYQALKEAFRQLVAAAGGVNRAVAEKATRADASRLSRYGSQHESLFAPLDVIADLEAAAGEPAVTRILADFAGFVLVPKEKAQGGAAQLTRRLGEVATTTAEVIGDLGAAVADGAVTDAERDRIDREVKAAETTFAGLRHDLEAGRGASPLPRLVKR